MRRQRLRNAIATARLASFCPIICASNSETISRGVIDINYPLYNENVGEMLLLTWITISYLYMKFDFHTYMSKFILLQ